MPNKNCTYCGVRLLPEEQYLVIVDGDHNATCKECFDHKDGKIITN